MATGYSVSYIERLRLVYFDTCINLNKNIKTSKMLEMITRIMTLKIIKDKNYNKTKFNPLTTI